MGLGLPIGIDDEDKMLDRSIDMDIEIGHVECE